MAYSYVEYVGTVGGTTGPFSYGSVELLDADTESIATQLKVYKNGTLLTITTDYTLDLINEEVDTVASIFNTDTLRIVRETKADARYVDYIDSTNVTSELLDLDSNQLFYLIQEATDLTNDAMVKGVDGQWNAQGRRIGNLATAVSGTDAVNLNQLQAATSGALPAVLSGIGTLVYTGDSSTTDFSLPAAVSSITDASDIEVYVNGLRQRPNTHYTVGSGLISFTSAPLTDDQILLAYNEGAVAAILTANSVLNSSIQANAVTVDKINPSATNGQVLITASGATAWNTLTADKISNFDTQVRTNRLDQMASATAAISMGSNKITSLATPTVSTDAANKSYVDTVQSATTSTISATSSGVNNDIAAIFNTGIANVGSAVLTVPVYNATTDTDPNQYIQLSFTCSGLADTTVFTGTGKPHRSFHQSAVGANNAIVTMFWKRSGADNSTLTVSISNSGSIAGFKFKAIQPVYGAFAKGSS